MTEFRYQKGDLVRLVRIPKGLFGDAWVIGARCKIVDLDDFPEEDGDDMPYQIELDGIPYRPWAEEADLELVGFENDQKAIDRLNAEADCYRKEAQEARALQRKFYDETQELRRLLAQVTAERDAANQQCACAVRQLDDLRACLKALAR